MSTKTLTMKTKLLFLITFLQFLVVKAQLPNPVLVGYWHNWHQTDMPLIKLADVDDRYNVICLSFAAATGGDINTLAFNIQSWGSSAGYNTAALKKDIEDARKKGKVVLMSVGGANGSFRLTTEAQKNTFVSKMKTIIQNTGVDGIDIDLEQKDYLCPGTSDTKRAITNPWPHMQYLIDGTKELMTWYQTQYGRKMILTTAPEVTYTSGGISPWNKCNGVFLQFLEAMRNDLDLVMVQLYNSGSVYSRKYTTSSNTTEYAVGTVDFVITQTEAMIEGFKFTNNHAGLSGTFSGIPQEKIAVALPANSCAAGSGYLNITNTKNAVNYLKGNGTKPGNYTLEKTYPKIRGLMTWSINQDNRSSGCSASKGQFAKIYQDLFPTINTNVITLNHIKIYPNPTHANFKIELQDLETSEPNFIQIFNINGQLIYQNSTAEEVIEIETNSWQSGLYLVSINGTSTKIIKE